MARPRTLARHLALALVLAAPLGGCASRVKVETEHVNGHDFSKYTTYRWLTDDLVMIQLGTGNPKIRNVENEKRVRAAVERELEARGLTKAEGDEAQLVIAFTVGTKVRYQIQGGATALDLVASEPASVTRGRLTLYFFDRERQAQVWSAWTSDDLQEGADPDAVINGAVALLMSAFPPS